VSDETQIDGQGNGRQGVDEVYRRVREAILEADLEPGQAMSQVALAAELGVSRTPLREALRMLQGEGLVTAEANRQVRVAAITVEDVEDLYAVRITLEVEALRLTVPRMAPEDIARLEGYIGEMNHYAEVDDYVRWVNPHHAYHRGLTALAGPRFETMLDQLFDQAERYRRLHVGQGPSPWGARDHREILDACKRGDVPASAALLARHLARTALEVAELINPEHDHPRLTQVLADVGGVTDLG